MITTLRIVGFILGIFLVSCQKDDDESRPYEFGFTIDGQQHRHEKKDVNGIIQGEFGFITADGIYHVTVYATDENGNFRILSMRNIRISAPLDGSPLPKGAKIESYPGAGQTQQQQPQAPVTQPPTNRPRTTYTFTTQPTIKPACGGCGYVTTSKPRPGERFPFQTPAFQKPNQHAPSSGFSNNPLRISNSNLEQPLAGAPKPGITGASEPPQLQNFPTPGLSNSNQIFPGTSNSNREQPLGGAPKPGITGASKPPQLQNFPTPGLSNSNQIFPGTSNSNRDQPLGGAPKPGITGASEPPQLQNIPTPGLANSNQFSPGTSFNSNRNQITGTQPRKPLSQVTVSDNAIHVPGNPDIPIRDKFPGMVDGLPDGITEKDITDLLYKFNYTVGFHGHYEKGLKNGAKIGGYFVTGRDGISRIVTYIADENGFRPKVKFVRLDLNSDEVPKEGTEKTFGLKNFEFVWYPIS